MPSLSRILVIVAGIALVAIAFVGGAYVHRWNLERWLAHDPCSAFAFSPDAGKFDIIGTDGRWCQSLGPVEQMSGVWVTGLEESSFAEDGSSVDPDDVWLEIDDVAHQLLLERVGGDPAAQAPQAVRLVFEGARSTKRGSHGHMGVSPHLVVVDKVVSARLLRGEEATRALEMTRKSSPPNHGGPDEI